MGSQKGYSDEDIIKIIDATCGCHPYCGSRCQRCDLYDYIIHDQIDDVRRLIRSGKVKFNEIGSGRPLLEIP